MKNVHHLVKTDVYSGEAYCIAVIFLSV